MFGINLPWWFSAQFAKQPLLGGMQKDGETWCRYRAREGKAARGATLKLRLPQIRACRLTSGASELGSGIITLPLVGHDSIGW